MIKRKIILPVAIVALSIAIALGLSMQQAPPQINERVLPTMLVNVVRAESGPEKIEVSAQGTVIPKTQTILVSEVSGLIIEVSPAFVAGGFFRKGDVLARIDDRNYRAEVKRAEAAVAAAETHVTRETGLADYAQQDWDRLRSSSASSKAASDLALRKPQVAEAIASLAFARADLEKRQGDLDRTVIKAPYDGLVREKIADLGQFVNAGSSLARTFSTDVAEIRLPLPDRELPFLDLNDTRLQRGEGPSVTFFATLGGKTSRWNGRIVRTEGVFDERSRVLYVVAQVNDPYNQHSTSWPEPLRIGTFVDARIDGAAFENIIRLPRDVLHNNNQVWTIADNNTLQLVEVNIARANEKSILISSGLVDGQLVCTSLLDNPLPGTPVRFDEPGVSFGDE